LPPQDLIYSVGLLDYVSMHRAKALTQKMYELLAPGGRLVIGNMNVCAMSNYWPMEYIVDWSLHYRDEAEMLAWVEGLDFERAWTETERTGRVRLLFVQKR
jgi:cyclopropane fatty-acyl-phospholipid synthase-like methyltransferase